ncbi:MAG TPA: DUF4440 domain-containing protein [Longimicrobiaceae bacterium]
MSRAAADAGVLEAQRDWWRAFTVADTAYLKAHTAPGFSVTLSSGRTYDRAGMLAEAATHVNGAGLDVRWADESVPLATPSAVVATGRVTETAAGTSHVYRYLTALERSGAGWRVAAAQSTREIAFTPQVPPAVSGPLADYAGGYRTPRGATLQVVVRDSLLGLVEPSGQELPMAPVGPGLFEFRSLSLSNGMVRFVFTRDASGRVVAMTRLVPGQVSTFPRSP